MSSRHKAYLILILVAAIWGFSSPIIKYAFTDFPPIIFLTYRFFITSVVMIPFLLITQPKTWHHLSNLDSKSWIFLVLTGFLGSTVHLGLLFWGLDLTTSLDASILSSTSPILVALAGHYFLKEKISRFEKIGMFIAFIGTIFMVSQPLFSGHKLLSGNVLGNSLVLLGTCSWVIYAIITKNELKHKLSPLLLTTVMFFAGFISMTVITIIKYSPFQVINFFYHSSLSGHLAVIFMAFAAGAFGFWAYQKAQKSIETSEANIFLYLSPLFTIPLSYFWLGEPITAGFIIGSVIIAAGVFISQLRR